MKNVNEISHGNKSMFCWIVPVEINNKTQILVMVFIQFLEKKSRNFPILDPS